MGWVKTVVRWFRWGWFPKPPTTPPSPNPPTGNDLLDEINRARFQHGMPPLENDACLSKEAQVHTGDMMRSGRLSHDGFGERLDNCRFQAGAENVAAGQRTERQVVDAWMTSAGHRRNILGQWTVAGTGRTGNWWCAIFARRRGD